MLTEACPITFMMYDIADQVINARPETYDFLKEPKYKNILSDPFRLDCLKYDLGFRQESTKEVCFLTVGVEFYTNDIYTPYIECYSETRNTLIAYGHDTLTVNKVMQMLKEGKYVPYALHVIAVISSMNYYMEIVKIGAGDINFKYGSFLTALEAYKQLIDE
jgi:uncharacterized membrane protein (UPF0136 family)